MYELLALTSYIVCSSPHQSDLQCNVKHELPAPLYFSPTAYHKSSLPTGSHVHTCLEAAALKWQITHSLTAFFKLFNVFSVSGAQLECMKRGLNGLRGCDAAKATQEAAVCLLHLALFCGGIISVRSECKFFRGGSLIDVF